VAHHAPCPVVIVRTPCRQRTTSKISSTQIASSALDHEHAVEEAVPDADVHVARVVTEGPPVKALLTAARSTDLLVVGFPRARRAQAMFAISRGGRGGR
jgi:nucleotide-binding universal stress UspA family protein